jgi:fluoride exporter
MIILAVFLGGGVGSVCRYLLGRLIDARSNSQFPVGTLVVNVLGCLAIGVLAKYFLNDQTHSVTRAALIVGFCGGFTTFSAFSLETLRLLTGGRPLTALAYVAASVGLCLLGTAAGYAIGSPAS